MHRTRLGSTSMFQSTPGSEEPGDGRGCLQSRPLHCFNPRPAPRSRATMLRSSQSGSCLFQSTPGSEEPGDSTSWGAGYSGFMFQSTPGSEEPGDQKSWDTPPRDRVSIHARLRGAGRPWSSRSLNALFGFNPRPAPRSRATSVYILSCSPGAFQSTPGSEEPGDKALIDDKPFDAVSIHARLRGAGRLWSMLNFGHNQCFNPRPAPRSRATHRQVTGRDGAGVSIHARLRGAGRPRGQVGL